MNEVIETTQQVTSIHNKTVEEWVAGYNDLIKHQHAQQGYYFMLAKKSLGKTWAEFSEAVGISQQSMAEKIKLYKDIKELARCSTTQRTTIYSITSCSSKRFDARE